MKFHAPIVFLAVLSLAVSDTLRAEPATTPLTDCNQLVVVVTKDWKAVPGTMFLFHRDNEKSPWRKVGKSFPVVVGRNGLGWGTGLNHSLNTHNPIKHEGDGKSPAGIFRLSSAFGTEEPRVSCLMPYVRLTDAVECVDDTKSTNYNLIVNREKIAAPDWNSSEKMRAVGERYRLGVVVEHNAAPRKNGDGSCIFLHIWLDAKTGTSGCTAMASENMESLLPWLNPSAHPALVQLPESEYKNFQASWSLPSL